MQWGCSLIATGGALNPDTCFWTVHHMTCDDNSKWGYSEARQPPSAAPAVPNEMDELDDFLAYESDKEDLDEDIDVILHVQ